MPFSPHASDNLIEGHEGHLERVDFGFLDDLEEKAAKKKAEEEAKAEKMALEVAHATTGAHQIRTVGRARSPSTPTAVQSQTRSPH